MRASSCRCHVARCSSASPFSASPPLPSLRTISSRVHNGARTRERARTGADCHTHAHTTVCEKERNEEGVRERRAALQDTAQAVQAGKKAVRHSWRPRGPLPAARAPTPAREQGARRHEQTIATGDTERWHTEHTCHMQTLAAAHAFETLALLRRCGEMRDAQEQEMRKSKRCASVSSVLSCRRQAAGKTRESARPGGTRDLRGKPNMLERKPSWVSGRDRSPARALAVEAGIQQLRPEPAPSSISLRHTLLLQHNL